jgi:hypothetical protein
MTHFELFSQRRQKAENAGKIDIFQYDWLPEPFVVQVLHIWKSAIGTYGPTAPPKFLIQSQEVWNEINNYLSREKGLFYLGDERCSNAEQHCVHHLMSQNTSTEDKLDLIEYSFAMVFKYDQHGQGRAAQSPTDAIEELNRRFRQHCIGYEFVGLELIRKDSQFVHSEVTLPALQLISGAEFKGASDEFLKAHEHYRHDRFKEAMNESLKALESTLKSICKIRKYEFAGNETASNLLKISFSNGLVPEQLQSHFNALQSCIASGVPTVRNKHSAHGQGVEVTEIPRHLVQFALNSTAAAILFLVESSRH